MGGGFVVSGWVCVVGCGGKWLFLLVIASKKKERWQGRERKKSR